MCHRARLQAAELPGRQHPCRGDCGQGARDLRHQPALRRERLKEAGILLLAEPINTFAIPGFYLNRTAQAIALIEEVASPNLWLQHDLYRMQRMEGELANTIAKHLPRIAHMRIADTPGRPELGSSEINYAWLLRFIDQLSYDAWIGCEYMPAASTREGLGWIKALTG